MASQQLKISKQETAGKKRRVTLTFHRNFKQVAGLKVETISEKLWLNKTFDHKLFMIQGKRRTTYDLLWHQVRA
jgi:hypothetical protein